MSSATETGTPAVGTDAAAAAAAEAAAAAAAALAQGQGTVVSGVLEEKRFKKGHSSVSIHPLVLINVGDHFTRVMMRGERTGDEKPFAAGALLGVLMDRKVEIFTSYELVIRSQAEMGDESHTLDREYYAAKKEQFSQVFPDYDVLGWYSTGEAVGPRELAIHQQILKCNESALYLQVQPQSESTSTDLPMTLYETILDTSLELPRVFLSPTAYKIETSDGEKIAVDHVATQLGQESEGTSTVNQFLSKQFNAIEMLRSRLSLITAFLADVRAGRVATDPSDVTATERLQAIVREASLLAGRLPAATNPAALDQEQLTMTNDVLLTTYMATMTNGCNHIRRLVEDFSVVNERKMMPSHPIHTMSVADLH